MEATLVFPHQLFYPNPSLSKRRKTFLIEDPLFLSDSKYPAVFHKQKTDSMVVGGLYQEILVQFMLIV